MPVLKFIPVSLLLSMHITYIKHGLVTTGAVSSLMALCSRSSEGISLLGSKLINSYFTVIGCKTATEVCIQNIIFFNEIDCGWFVLNKLIACVFQAWLKWLTCFVFDRLCLHHLLQQAVCAKCHQEYPPLSNNGGKKPRYRPASHQVALTWLICIQSVLSPLIPTRSYYTARKAIHAVVEGKPPSFTRQVPHLLQCVVIQTQESGTCLLQCAVIQTQEGWY